MGNISSSGGNGRRRHNRRRRNQTASPPPPLPPPPPPLPPPPPATEMPANRIVFAAASPYPNYHQFPAYYRTPPGTMPVPPYDHYPPPHPPPHTYHHPLPWTTGGRYPYGVSMVPPPLPYVEHQKAVTIRNDVNLKKETLRLEPDPDNPSRYLVSFTFDATVSGR